MNNVETKKNFDLRSESGFTLMELIVVIGVLAILMTILIPQFNGYTDKAKAVAARAAGKNALTAVSSYALSSETAGRTFDTGVAETRIVASLNLPANGDNGITVTVTSQRDVIVVKEDGDLTFTNQLNPEAGTQVLSCADATTGSTRCADLLADGNIDI